MADQVIVTNKVLVETEAPVNVRAESPLPISGLVEAKVISSPVAKFEYKVFSSLDEMARDVNLRVYPGIDGQRVREIESQALKKFLDAGWELHWTDSLFNSRYVIFRRQRD